MTPNRRARRRRHVRSSSGLSCKMTALWSFMTVLTCFCQLPDFTRALLSVNPFTPLFQQHSMMRTGPGNCNNMMAPSGDAAASGERSSQVDLAHAFDATVLARYACTRFQRYDGNATTTTAPSPSNPEVVRQAFECLNLARRAPSGFNSQPYKLLLVHSPEKKKALARYCIGHNAHRVRDSDCTALFLADREACRTLGLYTSELIRENPKWKDRKWALIKMQALIALFSSGYPLPRFLVVPISFCVRTAMSLLSILTGRRLVLPSLSGAETWSVKNTMLVAMSYMLGCTARGVATCPMEGFHAGGIRRALGIPRRYAIPLIVSTGTPYIRPTNVTAVNRDTADDMGISHGSTKSDKSTKRYPVENVMYTDSFGNSGALPA